VRNFRFALSRSRVDSRAEWVEFARRTEDLGYDLLMVADHLGALGPFPALQAAADATERLRIGTNVLNNDFRNPLLVAQETATIDLLSGGRFELGMGAGWNIPEYEQAGIPFDSAGVRIARLEESVAVLRRLFAGEQVDSTGEHYQITSHTLDPLPPQGAALPILIGGNGNRLLGVAGRHATVVGFTGFTIRPQGPVPSHFTRSGLADRIEVVRAAAGKRFSELELSVLVQRVEVTNDPTSAAEELATSFADGGGSAPSPDEILDSPFALLGSVDQICERLQSIREELGVATFTVFDARSAGFDAVVARLAAT